MPKADGAKTKSAHNGPTETNLRVFSSRGQNGSHSSRLVFSLSPRRKRVLLYAVGVLAALFAVLAPSLFYRPPTAHLQVAGQTVSLGIARTAAQRTAGLSGRKNLPTNTGMLFVFAKPDAACLWMKDMNFPLDMVWLSSAKKVTYVQENVSPKTYPKSFCPPQPARYVIELPAGQVQQLNIHTGQKLNF